MSPMFDILSRSGSGNICNQSPNWLKNHPKFHMFLALKFLGAEPPPEFLDLIYKIELVSDHVANFHGDRSRDLGENLTKEKKKHHGKNIRPTVRAA